MSNNSGRGWDLPVSMGCGTPVPPWAAEKALQRVLEGGHDFWLKRNLNFLSSVQTYFQIYLGLRFVSLHASAGNEVNYSWKEELPCLFLEVSAPKDRKGFQCLKMLFY